MTEAQTRVLVVDDNIAIHDDIRNTLCPTLLESDADLEALKAELFGGAGPDKEKEPPPVELSFAHQGKEGFEMVKQACESSTPFSVAIVDMRMPPGWDGLDTIEHLWKVDPKLQIIICTAFSDHSWAEITERLKHSEGLLVLKKPFEPVELHQMVAALSAKWASERKVARHLAQLDDLVARRTAELRHAYESLRAEVVERQRVEIGLRHAQKMEAIGQLAAGIAHEINTPIQFVTDSVYFLKEAVESFESVVDHCRSALDNPGVPPGIREDLALTEEKAELGLVQKEWPRALQRSLDGLERVAAIVRAMRNFAHPGGQHPAAADLNAALTNTLAVTHSVCKFVARVETDLENLPPVVCHLSDMNQVFLNLIVNAAQAIEERTEGESLGTIRISTRHEGAVVKIAVEDDGRGIPEEIRDRIFEPFFTTKPIGKGTGQGLAIVHSLVVGRHGGKVDVDTSGRGTRFEITLPIKGPFY